MRESEFRFDSVQLMFYIPSGMQHPENISLWSYSGWDVPDNNRNIIGRIRFLTCFGSAMPGMRLALRSVKKNVPKNLFYGKCLKWCPDDVTLQVSLWDVFRTFIGCFSKTGRMYNNYLLSIKYTYLVN